MPLQNRVKPNGEIVATAERGIMMGNRGGKFHRDDKTLAKRRWASTHWICCELHWKNQHHEPMGQGYTSLFFLDEVTALAAGHRPCFFCRRQEAKKFLSGRKVNEFDQQLHAERTAKSPHPPVGTFPQWGKGDNSSLPPQGEGARMVGIFKKNAQDEGLPTGTMFEREGNFYALRKQKLLRWSYAGYISAHALTPMKVLTPPSIIAILQKGYEPRWHESAHQWD